MSLEWFFSEALLKSQTPSMKRIKPSHCYKDLQSHWQFIFTNVSCITAYKRPYHLRGSGFPSWIFSVAGCWLFIIMVSKDENFAHVECRYSWPLKSIVLKPGKNMRTLVILNKSDKVMSGFKERSVTDCTIVCNFQYILLFSPWVLIINCLLF